MTRAVIIWCVLAAPSLGQELMRRDGPIPTYFSADKKPATATSTAAKREAMAWLTKWAQDKPKGWKVTGWEYRGDYSGQFSNSKRWTMYRMTINPPISDVTGPPYFEAWFGFDGKNLAFPVEQYSRSMPLPRVPAVIEMPNRR